MYHSEVPINSSSSDAMLILFEHKQGKYKYIEDRMLKEFYASEFMPLR